MNKMMNPEMEVVRFGAEDVIATSGGFNFLYARTSRSDYAADTGITTGLIEFYSGPEIVAKNHIGTIGFKYDEVNKFAYVGKPRQDGRDWVKAENDLLITASSNYSGVAYNNTSSGNNVMTWLNGLNGSNILVDKGNYILGTNGCWTSN